MFKNALVSTVFAASATADKKGRKDDAEIAICRMTTNSGVLVNAADVAGMPGGFFSLRQTVDDMGVAGKLRIAGVGFNLSQETSHAFHIHAGAVDFTADPATTDNICATAGGHFNPGGNDHGAWDDAIETRHVGDLMQLWTDSLGKSVYAYETMYGNIVDPADADYIVGNAMTIHLLVDDEGLVDSDASRKGGSAGERIACCNIELSNSKRYNRIWEDLEELVEDELNYMEETEKSEKSEKSEKEPKSAKETTTETEDEDEIDDR